MLEIMDANWYESMIYAEAMANNQAIGSECDDEVAITCGGDSQRPYGEAALVCDWLVLRCMKIIDLLESRDWCDWKFGSLPGMMITLSKSLIDAASSVRTQIQSGEAVNCGSVLSDGASGVEGTEDDAIGVGAATLCVRGWVSVI
jgi:hypothetical protein